MNLAISGLQVVIPAKEVVIQLHEHSNRRPRASADPGRLIEIPEFPLARLERKSTIGWIGVVRPSRRPLRGLLRMRNFLTAIKGLPHAEEHPKGASRSTHGLAAGLFPSIRQFVDTLLRGNDEIKVLAARLLAGVMGNGLIWCAPFRARH
jgi:hypothetical protein